MPQDCILHVLPLHHTHGMINCLLCPLAVGAKIVMLPKFDASKVWEILLDRNETHINSEVDVFMAVPTIYAKLIQKFNEPGFQSKYNRADVKETIMEKVRLMVCGSAALPAVSFPGKTPRKVFIKRNVFFLNPADFARME